MGDPRIADVDAAFDRLYPAQIRARSRGHATPVAVAIRAAQLLAPEPGMAVLDVGAGAGKLCCVGALVGDARWHGVELDPTLVAAARQVARRLGLARRASFSVGDLEEHTWRRFDSLYFYNPFESALFAGGRADRGRWAVFDDRVARAEAALAALPAGTRVVTLHGFGGELPAGFARLTCEPVGGGVLALWVRRAATTWRGSVTTLGDQGILRG
jgi:predicted RNA methylase